MSDQNLPRPAGDVVEDGVPATEEVRDEVLRTGDAGVPDMPMPDRPWGAEQWGTTGEEQRQGEPIGRRIAREEPEGEEQAGGGRLLEPGAEDGILDSEADTVGEVDPSHSDTLAAEEAAMSVRGADEGLGITQDDDPGYLEDR
jgi:hypothetical protein